MRYSIRYLAIVILFVINYTTINAQQPVPSKKQLAWHNMEFYLFTHFGPNTYTDKEWGLGNEPEDVFNPEHLDCRQWCRVAKAAGAKGIIITAKHHDGFCLWPSKYSTHTVKESKWRNGKGDVLKELSQACKEYGLKFGVYISPWDRNHPKYGTPEYNDVFVNMMKEILTNYGPIWELWWDGANGEGPNGKKMVYDWERFKKTVHDLSPNTVVFSDIGPDIRWVGNEEGHAGITNWNMIDTVGYKPGAGSPPLDTLNHGIENGHAWIPAECDVSIRPGWFYHPEQDQKVKTPEELFELYLKSVGRGGNLLLNVPPDRNGQITKYDSTSLVGFRKLREESFKNNLAKQARIIWTDPDLGHEENTKVIDGKSETFQTMGKNSLLEIRFDKPKKVNCIVLMENLEKGQQCAKIGISPFGSKSDSVYEVSCTTIGRKRILTFPAVLMTSIIFQMDQQENPTRIAEVGTYLIDEKLIEKGVTTMQVASDLFPDSKQKSSKPKAKQQ